MTRLHLDPPCSKLYLGMPTPTQDAIVANKGSGFPSLKIYNNNPGGDCYIS